MLNLVIGLLLGGCIAAVILCCVQINRIGYYEQEIRGLKEKLNNRDEQRGRFACMGNHTWKTASFLFSESFPYAQTPPKGGDAYQ